jgi:hypothetical protein
MERDIIYDALHHLETKTGIRIAWHQNRPGAPDTGIDGVLNLHHNRKKITLPAEIKNNVNYTHLQYVNNLKRKFPEIVLIAEYFPEKMAKTMQEMQLNYLDAAGNTCIKTKEIFILIEGNKQNKIDIDKTVKVFSKTGIKVVFQFIHEQELINDTIRNIADRTGVSLDTVHKTIQALRQMRYIIPVTKGKWIWDNRYELFEKWVNEYAAKLKPGLHVGNFRFVKEENFNKWKQLKLFRSTCWGGEPAGELLTNYLNPETLTIYTAEPKADLIKNYKMIGDPNGHIRVYQKFWNDAIQEKHIAPGEIVYADLINTGNKRNIQTAQKVYERFLQDKF